MKPRKLLERIASGATKNVSFDDFCTLIDTLGFELDRTRGSHRLYLHCKIGERLNVQPLKSGDAKPYQIGQLMALVRRYHLWLEDG